MADAAPPKRKKRKAASSEHRNARTTKRKRQSLDLASLKARVTELDVTPAAFYDGFADLPLSDATAKGLTDAHFTTLTDIQRRAIPLALQGRDILGAAKTGSGKTLAFLVPMLENLVRRQWGDQDGLGALILAPTRELAIQIFQVLRQIGKYHNFSAGLVIGGKNLKGERERLGRMNILVCTPGRMLQHLDQTPFFESEGLQMLILDEADRILDLGFQSTVDAIIDHLPRERQTLLFSATQTRRVADLARLSLQDPEYVAVHQDAASATPQALQQHYVVVPLHEKLDTLWSFLRSDIKKKILVFMSSGKQVRYVFETFRHLQPGIPLLHLHGRQKQETRLGIVTQFGAAQHACMFSTDIAARGLDFPAVDWVIQVDCPEDADTYIHRAGRTARYEKSGRAVLFLTPSEEEAFLRRLKQKKVPIEEIRIRQKKQMSIQGQLANMCFGDPELKHLGQKAFISYAKSVHTQSDKEVFQLKQLPMEEFAASLGLPGTPRIKFQAGNDAKKLKNMPRDQGDVFSDEEAAPKTKPRSRYDRMFARVNQDVLAPHYTTLLDDEQKTQANGANGDVPSDEAEEFLTVKRRHSISHSSIENAPIATKPSTLPPSIPLGTSKEPLAIDSVRRGKLLQSKKALLKHKELGQKILFDDSGNVRRPYDMQDESAFHAEGDALALRDEFVRAEGDRLQERDREDKATQKDKRRAVAEQRKERERRMRRGSAGGKSEEDEAAADERLAGNAVELASLGSDEEIGMDLDALNWDDVRHVQSGGDAGSDRPDQPNGGKAKAKKAKKWFQSSSDDDDDTPQHAQRRPNKSKKKGRKDGHGRIQTLEDLEALASQYM